MKHEQLEIEKKVLREIALFKSDNPKDYDYLQKSAETDILKYTLGEHDWLYKVTVSKVARAISVRQEKMGYISKVTKKAHQIFNRYPFPKQALAPWMYALDIIDLVEVERMLGLSTQRYAVEPLPVPKKKDGIVQYFLNKFKSS